MRRASKPISILVSLLAIYLGTYLCLTLNGRYEPLVVGLSGPKGYDWVPLGFGDSHKLNLTMWGIFFPPHYLDRKYWHVGEPSYYSAPYPINRSPVASP